MCLWLWRHCNNQRGRWKCCAIKSVNHLPNKYRVAWETFILFVFICSGFDTSISAVFYKPVRFVKMRDISFMSITSYELKRLCLLSEFGFTRFDKDWILYYFNVHKKGYFYYLLHLLLCFILRPEHNLNTKQYFSCLAESSWGFLDDLCPTVPVHLRQLGSTSSLLWN